MKTILRWVWRGVRGVLLAFAALILFLEEWGWRPLTAWAARLAKWPPLARLEQRIAALPPKGALLLFLVPAIALFPVKLLALWLIHLGRGTLGVLVIIAAKLLGTALVGRLFILTERQLVQFAWFARSLAWWRATKARVRAAVERARAWRVARASARRWRGWLRRLLQRLMHRPADSA
jgi:hypothetical protein